MISEVGPSETCTAGRQCTLSHTLDALDKSYTCKLMDGEIEVSSSTVTTAAGGIQINVSQM